MEKTIIIGTRGSQLALWQAEKLKEILQKKGIGTQIKIIKTLGDQNQVKPLHRVGRPGLFTRELEEALLEKSVDIAVHSCKDLPGELESEFEILSFFLRERVEDAFLSEKFTTLEGCPPGAKIGTGSLRRRAQLKNQFGDKFQILPLRGNVDTRLRKLKSGEYDAIILAAAGLIRLGHRDQIKQFLKTDSFLPAPCQGILALEVLKENRDLFPMVKEALYPFQITPEALAERGFLQAIKGGCSQPIAALAARKGENLTIEGRVYLLETGTYLGCVKRGSVEEAEKLGKEVAFELIKMGAKDHLQKNLIFLDLLEA